MIDPATTPLADPASASATQAQSDPDQQDPLDILEGILKNAQQQSDRNQATADQKRAGGGPAFSVDDGEGASEDSTEVDQANQETERLEKIAELEEMQAAGEVRRVEEVAAQKAKLAEELPKTAAYQARMEQKSDQDVADSVLADEGFNIQQLDHTKIPDDNSI